MAKGVRGGERLGAFRKGRRGGSGRYKLRRRLFPEGRAFPGNFSERGLFKVTTERLDKLLASQGTASRSQVKALIRSGAVTVNGETERRGERQVSPEADRVAVNGRAVSLEKHVYLMLHKPQGVVSATKDPKEPTVLDLVPPPCGGRGCFRRGGWIRTPRAFC